jgi:hypothetical protein
MSLLPDGRVAYLLRKPRRDGATHLVLDPVHFLARISALVPPPSYPLTRLAGVLAPHSTWRDAVVKYGRDETTAPPAPAAEKRGAKKKKTDVRVPSGPRTSLCPCGGRRRIIADVEEPSATPSTRFVTSDPPR